MAQSAVVSTPLFAPESLFSTSSPAPRRRRTTLPGTVVCILTAIALVSALVTLLSANDSPHLKLYTPAVQATESVPAPAAPSPADLWAAQVSKWVKGDPTDKFQDNLRDDMKYVTSWVSGGWTNDFMNYINMIYLGTLTSRIPIIPPFVPSHLPYDAGFPPFGDVFDVPRLSAAIHTPLLEWRDVKREGSREMDQVGCWSTWSLVNNRGVPRHSIVPGRLNLDVAYTGIPRSTNIISRLWISFSSLASLGFPQGRAQALAENPPQTAAPHSGAQPVPDEQLMCFDFMYYIGAARHDEWWAEWSPAWHLVGQHARWAPQLERLALRHIRRALALDEDGDDEDGADEDGAAFPPYIGVHVRRGDFTAACGTAAEECFQPLAAYARRVAEIAATLYRTQGLLVPVHHVLVTSDEHDPIWWDEVAALGWRWVDHARERTEERYGKWYAPLIDAVVQSRGVGFVGTDRSTMSLVAKRRVEDWQQGIGYLVRIGSKGADAT